MIRSKPIIQWSVGILCFLTILEVGSYLGLQGLKRLPETSYQQVYSSLANKKQTLKNHVYQTGWSAIRPHPYWGYVQAKGNNHGFSNSVDFPYVKKNNEYVIGLFGGSVAWSLGSSTGIKTLLKKLKTNITQLKNKKLVLLNMSMGAYKQPQAFLISTYYSQMFDLVINLDGWNEIQPRTYHRTPVYRAESATPESFPAFAEVFFSRDQETYLSLGRNVFVTDIKKKIAERLSRSALFSRSSTIFLMWEIVRNLFSGEEIVPEHRDYWRKNQVEQRVLRRAKLWARYTRMQSTALASVGVPSVFFIQPNHHYRDSKPIAPNEPFYSKEVTEITQKYNALDREAQILRKSGVSVYDLFSIFKNEKRAIYIDDCHVNDLGNEIIAQAIADRLIEKSEQFF